MARKFVKLVGATFAATPLHQIPTLAAELDPKAMVYQLPDQITSSITASRCTGMAPRMSTRFC